MLYSGISFVSVKRSTFTLKSSRISRFKKVINLSFFRMKGKLVNTKTKRKTVHVPVVF